MDWNNRPTNFQRDQSGGSFSTSAQQGSGFSQGGAGFPRDQPQGPGGFHQRDQSGDSFRSGEGFRGEPPFRGDGFRQEAPFRGNQQGSFSNEPPPYRGNDAYQQPPVAPSQGPYREGEPPPPFRGNDGFQSQQQGPYRDQEPPFRGNDGYPSQAVPSHGSFREGEAPFRGKDGFPDSPPPPHGPYREGEGPFGGNGGYQQQPPPPQGPFREGEGQHRGEGFPPPQQGGPPFRGDQPPPFRGDGFRGNQPRFQQSPPPFHDQAQHHSPFLNDSQALSPYRNPEPYREAPFRNDAPPQFHPDQPTESLPFRGGDQPFQDFHRSPSQRQPVFAAGRVGGGPPPPPNLGGRQASGFRRQETEDPRSQPRDNRWTASPPTRVPPILRQTSSSSAGPPPAPVLTETALPLSALGEENVEKADKVVKLLHRLMDKSMEPGETVVLPKKQEILDALQKMDSKIKDVQTTCVDKQVDLDRALSEEKATTAEVQVDKVEVLNKEYEDNESKVSDDGVTALKQAVQKILEEKRGSMNQSMSEMTAEADQKISAALKEAGRQQEIETEAEAKESARVFDGEVSVTTAQIDSKKQSIDSIQNTVADEAEEEKDTKTKDDKPNELEKTSDIVSRILAENQRKAAEANLSMFSCVSADSEEIHITEDQLLLEQATDPKEGKTSAEWSLLTQQVTGLSDALYSEPSEAPYFELHEERHELIGPIIKEYIRDKRRRLRRHWTNLAQEYEQRRVNYEEHRKQLSKRNKNKNSVLARNTIIPRQVVPLTESTTGSTATARASTNPYRRARRGNEVRSDYEQEQIIAELAAKEAMEKRIALGGCGLPRQVGRLERSLTARFFNTFVSQQVDVVQVEADDKLANVWTDTEKCIFLDRFMQHPKDFRKIASFLRNKTTKDCVRFYYDSKQSIPFKGALREHIMRRKSRGDCNKWSYTIQAALSVGAVVQAGPSEEKPLVFLLPKDDMTYHTRLLHPLRREIFDSLEVEEVAASQAVEEMEIKTSKGEKRKAHELFLLDPEQRKFLRPETPESDPSVSETQNQDGDGGETTARRAPKKWTTAEKRIFMDIVEKHDRPWEMLEKALTNKTRAQIKNFYYDYHKTTKKGKPDRRTVAGRARLGGATTPPISAYEESYPATPVPAPSVSDTGVATSRSWIHQLQQQQLQQQAQHLLSPTDQHTASTMELLHAHSRQLELDRARTHSGTSTPDALTADHLWLQSQQQSLLQQQQSHQSAEDAARRILQQHQSQVHQQQLLSSLLPSSWLSGSQGHHGSEWSDTAQQLQLLQLQQQQQQHQLSSLGGSSLHSMLSGLGGVNNSSVLAQLEQQQQRDDMTHRLLALQQGTLDPNSANATLQLLQRLQQQQDQGGGYPPGGHE